LTDEDEAAITDLALFATAARSVVHRDRQGNIDTVPGEEMPARFTKQAATLLAGCEAVGLDRTAALALLGRVALDSIPPKRAEVLAAAYWLDEPTTTLQLGERLARPTRTVRNALDDVTAYGLMAKDTSAKAHRFQLTDEGRGYLDRVWKLTEPHQYPTLLSRTAPSTVDATQNVIDALNAEVVAEFGSSV
jgi:hypothetical protein